MARSGIIFFAMRPAAIDHITFVPPLKPESSLSLFSRWQHSPQLTDESEPQHSTQPAASVQLNSRRSRAPPQLLPAPARGRAPPPHRSRALRCDRQMWSTDVVTYVVTDVVTDVVTAPPLRPTDPGPRPDPPSPRPIPVSSPSLRDSISEILSPRPACLSLRRVSAPPSLVALVDPVEELREDGARHATRRSYLLG